MAAYEVNISCPNVDAGGMTMGCHVPSVEKVVSLCRAATKRPLIVKLTPNVTDITEIAKAAEAAGADGISLINTLLGMAVDARTRRPKLARVVGGYSGPAVKPVALRMVWQVAQAVSVPVLGMGGIIHRRGRRGVHAGRRHRGGRGHGELRQSHRHRRRHQRHYRLLRIPGRQRRQRADRSPAMLTAFDSVPARDRVIVALDCDAWEAIALADKLEGHAKWLKIGMTLYYAEGPAIVKMFKRRGFNVFLDLKFHDIPHQVQGAARSAAASGADMLTMHTVGGTAMMEAGQRGAEEGAAEYGGDVPATLGITVLTSMSPEALAATGVARPLPEQVAALAAQAKEAGISGVVASPQEAAALREIFGPTPSSSPPACARPAPPWETRAAWPRPPRPSRTERRTSWWAGPSPRRTIPWRPSRPSPRNWSSSKAFYP